MTDEKVSRGKFDEITTNYLNLMLKDLKTRGAFVKLTPSDLACWIIRYFKENLFERKKDLLYFSFVDDSSYAKELIASKVPLEDIEQSLREFRRKRAEIFKNSKKTSKLEVVDEQLQTSPSVQRKVGFDD